MNKTLKICIGIFIWLIILAIGAGVFIGLSMTPEDWNTTEIEKPAVVPTSVITPIITPNPTPTLEPTLKEITSKDGFTIDEVREFDNVNVRFMSYTFDMKGEINWDGERYWTRKCHGWTDDHMTYAYIVCNDYETECFIALQHGYGSTEYDYEVSDRLWRNMIKNSKQIT